MKWFALLGLLLFLGVAVAPSINAGVAKENQREALFNEYPELKGYLKELHTIDFQPLKTLLELILIFYEISSMIAFALSVILTLVFIQLCIKLEEQDKYPSLQKLLEFGYLITGLFMVYMLNFGGLFILPIYWLYYKLYPENQNNTISDIALNLRDTHLQVSG